MAAPILVTPSDEMFNTFLRIKDDVHTCNDHGTTYSPRSSRHRGKVDVHCVDDIFEVKWDLDIQDLAYL